jgi:hypothetical protein
MKAASAYAKPLMLCAILVGAWLTGSAFSPALAQSDLPSTAADPVLPDPVPGQGGNFSPSAVTSGQAYAGPPLATPRQDCSPFNPCALASSEPHKMAPPLAQ